MDRFERIDIHRLIYNGLEHIEFELNRTSTSYARIAREAHQVLYRSMISALRGTSNITVTGKRTGNREHRYQFDNESIKEIHKADISGCKYAWRYSVPRDVASFLQLKQTHNLEEDYLIAFYDALAMVQADCFMRRTDESRHVVVSDEEMRLLERLHEEIRNEYEHFVPKGSSYEVLLLLESTKLALAKSYACLFESNNVSYYAHSVAQSDMQSRLNNTIALVNSHRDVAAAGART